MLKTKKNANICTYQCLLFNCGLTSFLQSLQCLISMLPIAVKHQNGSSSKQYSSWAYSLISCIISSRTFVTNTTYIGFQFGGFVLFFSKYDSCSHSYFLFFEYIAQYFIKKGFMSQAKSFCPSLRRC